MILGLFIVGLLCLAFSAGIFTCLAIQRERMRRSVTKHARRESVHRRQYRDRDIPEVANDWDAVDRGVNYTFINIAGEIEK